MSNKQKNGSRAGSPGQLMIPLVALGILILFNLFRDPSFFAIGIAVNNSGNSVLSGADRISPSARWAPLQAVSL